MVQPTDGPLKLTFSDDVSKFAAERRRRLAMWVFIVATVSAGLFSGAAIYINAVEHPARLSCGTELAVREFAPSYRRATAMQASLASPSQAA
jgi:hypothetical protein